MAILITGGAGYIGSHTCVQLLEAGYVIVVVDNLSNSSVESIDRVKQLSAKAFAFVKADIRDAAAMRTLFKVHTITAVIHFAGLKAVGESAQNPPALLQ